MTALSGAARANYGRPVFQRDGYACVYCGFDGAAFNQWRQLTVHHLRPVSAGGSDSPDNLVTACRFCDSVTNHMTFPGQPATDDILRLKKERVKDRLEALRGFWQEKVPSGGPASPSRDGGQILSAPLLLDLSSLQLTGRQLEKLSSDNEPLRLEFTARGELVITPPAGLRVGWAEGRLYLQVTMWADRDGAGVTFGPSAGFRLPNGAVYAPGVAWTTRERWQQWLAEQEAGSASEVEGEREEEEVFGSFCPDFLIELRSPSDTLIGLRRKMDESMENGCRLGFLIDPGRKRVHVYRPGTAPSVLDDPESVSGDPVLPGLELNVREIW